MQERRCLGGGWADVKLAWMMSMLKACRVIGSIEYEPATTRNVALGAAVAEALGVVGRQNGLNNYQGRLD